MTVHSWLSIGLPVADLRQDSCQREEASRDRRHVAREILLCREVFPPAAGHLRNGARYNAKFDATRIFAMSYPAIRMRRMRRDAFSRALMRETVMSPSDLILPVFVQEGSGEVRDAVASMPGVARLSIRAW